MPCVESQPWCRLVCFSLLPHCLALVLRKQPCLAPGFSHMKNFSASHKMDKLHFLPFPGKLAPRNPMISKDTVVYTGENRPFSPFSPSRHDNLHWHFIGLWSLKIQGEGGSKLGRIHGSWTLTRSYPTYFTGFISWLLLFSERVANCSQKHVLLFLELMISKIKAEAEAGGTLWFWGQSAVHSEPHPELCSETLFQSPTLSKSKENLISSYIYSFFIVLHYA